MHQISLAVTYTENFPGEETPGTLLNGVGAKGKGRRLYNFVPLKEIGGKGEKDGMGREVREEERGRGK